MGTLPKGLPIEGVQGPADYADVLGLAIRRHLIEIPVTVDQPLTVRALPAVDGQTNTVAIGTGIDGVKLLSENPLRGRALLVADGDYYLGFTKGEVEGGRGRVPAGHPIELTARTEIWVAGDAATSATYVTAVAEFWTH
jgi:hypothetical protein